MMTSGAIGIWPPESRFSPAWQQYLMGFARHAATKSKDSTQVGAVLVGPENEVRLSAYNGPPKGVRDLPERFERPEKYAWVSHSEANLIAFAAREGIRTKGCTVFVTHMCCNGCAKTLIQAGISAVYYCDGAFGSQKFDEEITKSRTMFEEAGVTLCRVET